MRVLILGARAPVCLEWARAFRASQWQVYAADSLAWPLTRASKAVDGYIRLPEPRYALHDWAQALANALTEHHIDLLLPTCEEAFYLAHCLSRMPAHCQVFCSPFDLMHQLHHKGRFAQLTQGWSVAAPQTHVLESVAAVQAMSATAAQWVFKPAYSRFAAHTLIAPNATQLASVQPTVQAPWVAQRLVQGREYCSFSLLVQGRVTAHACYHPRHRVGRGSGIWFEPSDPQAVREFVQQFGQATGYTGQVGFDFMEDAQGRFHVLECNPRGTSGIHLFDDQAQALVDALQGHRAELLCPVPRARMVALAMLLFAAPRAALRGVKAWRALAADYAAASDVVARPGDVGPLLAQVPGLIEIVGRSLRRRMPLLQAATHDIEWNGQPLESSPP
jgi:hypothetical protein